MTTAHELAARLMDYDQCNDSDIDAAADMLLEQQQIIISLKEQLREANKSNATRI